MSKFTELQILKAEERTMMGILSRMNDQLNRLKVEELALMSKIRTSEEESNPSTSSTPAASTTSVSTTATSSKPSHSQPLVESPWLESAKILPTLELGLARQLGRELVEEEEEEEYDDDDEDEMDMDEEPESAHDQLTAFLKQLQSNS